MASHLTTCLLTPQPHPCGSAQVDSMMPIPTLTCRTYALPYISTHIADLAAWIPIAPVGLQDWAGLGNLPSEAARKKVIPALYHILFQFLCASYTIPTLVCVIVHWPPGCATSWVLALLTMWMCLWQGPHARHAAKKFTCGHARSLLKHHRYFRASVCIATREAQCAAGQASRGKLSRGVLWRCNALGGCEKGPVGTSWAL
jgi:hypothetical protein